MRKKRNYTLLDTNIIIAFLDKKDSLHAVVEKMIKEDNSDEYSVLDILLGETYSVLVRRCKERKQNCYEAIERLKEFEDMLCVIPINLEEYHEKIVDKLKECPELNYNDCLLIIYALENNCTVLTLDKKLNEELIKNYNQ